MMNLDASEPKVVRRLNATLPDTLGKFVAEITGSGGLYETPSEFVRDLIRRYMENVQKEEYQEINAMLLRSVSENSYSDWSGKDLDDLRQSIKA